MTTIFDPINIEFANSSENIDTISGISSSSFISSNNSNGSETLRDFLQQSKPEFIRVVPNHWLDQAPPVHDTQITISVLLLFICVPANISQILVVYAFSRRFSLRTASNKLLISLLLADFLLLFNCYQTIIQNFSGDPIFGTIGCDFYGFNASVAALAEIWSLAFVSFDRFLAIYFPLDRRKRITKSQADVIILSVWGSSILFAILPLAGWNKFVSEAYFMGCAFDSFSSSWTDRSYVLTLLVLAWLIPLVSNIVFYVSMIYRVRTSDFQYYVIKQAKQDCYQMFNVDNRLQMEMKLAKMACTILLVWFIAWTPYAVMSFWVMFFNGNGLTPVLGLLPTICTKGSAFANALLYGLRLPKFKAEIKTIGKLIVPRSIARYFSSVKESSNCSKNIFSQAATKSSISFESQESTYTHCTRSKNQKLNQSSSKSIDPPNLVRLESISTCSTPTSTRRSKLSPKSKISKKTKTKRKAATTVSCPSSPTEKVELNPSTNKSSTNCRENRRLLKSTLILNNILTKRNKKQDVENVSRDENFESIPLVELKNNERREASKEPNKHQLITSIHHHKPNSMILEGKYIDIHETNALEPYDLGIDDIPYIDES